MQVYRHVSLYLSKACLKICALMHIVLDKLSSAWVTGVLGSSLQKPENEEKAPGFLCSLQPPALENGVG